MTADRQWREMAVLPESASPSRRLSLGEWLLASGLAIGTMALLQLAQHRFFMQLPMLWYHVVAATLNGIVVTVAAGLFLRWRRSAHLAEQALASLRASEELREDMVNMLVHDLKNPLAASIGSLQVVVQRASADAQPLSAVQERLLANALRGQLRLEGMIGDILEVARAEAGKMPLTLGNLDLCEVARNAAAEVRVTAEERGIHIHVDCQASPVIQADAQRVRRVLDNLLANALKFTPSGGQIAVSVAEGPVDARVSVQDTGHGVPAHLQECIFDRFGQGRAARAGQRTSVGLGLTFCKMAVEAHGGRIWVESAPERGTTFTFTLPLHRASEQPA